jgi:hypothetical protein
MTGWDLDDTVLEAYIHGFYGHGGYEAKYWFVGMEFGGGGSATEIVDRIQGWHDRGGKELEDLAGPEGIANRSRWFQPPYPLQPTWKQLIRIVLSAEAEPSGREDVRAYQKERLGRQDGLDCILDLLPLPSPGLNRWLFYPDYSHLPYLGDRWTYVSHVAPSRAAHLRERIAEHRPDSVIFYGAGYEHWWRAISGVEFKPSEIDKVSVARKGRTLFVTMQHATARGLPNSYFDAVGRFIAGALHA